MTVFILAEPGEHGPCLIAVECDVVHQFAFSPSPVVSEMVGQMCGSHYQHPFRLRDKVIEQGAHHCASPDTGVGVNEALDPCYRENETVKTGMASSYLARSDVALRAVCRQLAHYATVYY